MAKSKKKNTAALKNTVEVLPAEITVAQPNADAQPEPANLVASSLSSPIAEPSRPHVVDFNTPRSVAHDNQAGVRLLKFEKFKQFQLKLPSDIPAEVDQKLKEQGWTYRPTEEVYTKQYGDQGTGAAYVEARRLYQDLCQQLSPTAGQAIPY